MPHRLGQRQTPEEVGQIVRQGEQLQPHLIIREVVAGKPCPFESVLAFLDLLFRRAAAVVEADHVLGSFPDVGHDELSPGDSPC